MSPWVSPASRAPSPSPSVVPQDGLHSYPAFVSEDGNVVVTVPEPFHASFRRPPQPDVGAVVGRDRAVFVVVGGGAAAAVCAQTLRERGFHGHIRMLTAEAHLPYDRVVISKALKPEPTLLRDAAFYAAHRIEVASLSAAVRRCVVPVALAAPLLCLPALCVLLTQARQATPQRSGA